MTELLAIPAWKTKPTTLDAWLLRFDAEGVKARSVRESPTAYWIEVPSDGLRGYAVMQGKNVEAINFEFDPRGHADVMERLARVARELGWELHEDDLDEDDESD